MGRNRQQSFDFCTGERRVHFKGEENTWGRSSIVDVESRSKNSKRKGSYSKGHLETSISKAKHLKALGSIRYIINAITSKFLEHLTQISEAVMQQPSS